jgi:transcriptional regulator with XRE-family HTH domain
VKQEQHKDFLIAFGRHLRQTRKNLGFSQEKLAYEAGILSLHILSNTLGIAPKELLNFEF